MEQEGVNFLFAFGLDNSGSAFKDGDPHCWDTIPLKVDPPEE